ncbi:hypothetical protein CKA32_005609 [Geitlerinema sp. FC II]|nr:hypothetical protein CKA32_005609 [Geitlerinema sp. FC II]
MLSFRNVLLLWRGKTKPHLLRPTFSPTVRLDLNECGS